MVVQTIAEYPKADLRVLCYGLPPKGGRATYVKLEITDRR